MIQRIQSLYLFLTTTLPLLFLKGPILSFINRSGSDLKVTMQGIFQTSGDTTPELIARPLLLQGVVILIPLVSAIALLAFKKRKLQLKITLILILLALLLAGTLGYYYISISFRDQGTIIAGFRMILPLLILVFSVLAYRSIRKDEELVRSYDRLR